MSSVGLYIIGKTTAMAIFKARPKKLKIVLVCKRLYTNKDLFDDQFGRLFHIPVQLAKLEHEVTVIALDYKSGRPQQVVELQAVRFISFPVASVSGVTFMVYRLYRELRRISPQVLIASGDTYIGGLTALMAYLLDRPWIFDVYDDYRCFASARIPGMKSLFRKLIFSADHVLVASKPLKKLLGSSSSSLTVVENGVDLSLFRPLERAVCRKRLNIPTTDVVVGFFGSIEDKRGTKILLEAAQSILPKYPTLRVLLAGKNNLSLELKGAHIDYRGMQPQTFLPTMINACDVVTIPYELDPQVEMSNPCKVAEYLACHIPVVVTKVSNMSEIFASTPEVLAQPGSVESLAEALLRQLKEPTFTPLPDGLSWFDLAQLVEQVLYHASTSRS